MTDYMIGSVHRHTIGSLADRAARVVMGYRSPRAVALDPEGKVWVDSPDHVAEVDLVGVYRPDGLLALTRAITEDLRHEVADRQLRPIPTRGMGCERKRAAA